MVLLNASRYITIIPYMVPNGNINSAKTESTSSAILDHCLKFHKPNATNILKIPIAISTKPPMPNI